MDKPKKAPAVPRDASPDVTLDAARTAGLRYHGPPAQIRPPGTNRLVPARALTGDEVRYFVADRKTLLWLLDRGFALGELPATKKEE